MLDIFLPDDAPFEHCSLVVPPHATPASVLEQLGVPLHQVHLVSINDKLIARLEWDSHTLDEGDALEVWPLLAGG